MLSREIAEAGMREFFAKTIFEQAGSFNNMLDPRLIDFDYDMKTLSVSFYVQDWMRNPSNQLHGGIMASALDFTMGLLCRWLTGGNMTPTISMSIDCLRPVGIGDTYIVRAECNKIGRTICFTAARAWAASDPDSTVSTASGSYFVRD